MERCPVVPHIFMLLGPVVVLSLGEWVDGGGFQGGKPTWLRYFVEIHVPEISVDSRL